MKREVLIGILVTCLVLGAMPLSCSSENSEFSIKMPDELPTGQKLVKTDGEDIIHENIGRHFPHYISCKAYFYSVKPTYERYSAEQTGIIVCGFNSEKDAKGDLQNLATNDPNVMLFSDFVENMAIESGYSETELRKELERVAPSYLECDIPDVCMIGEFDGVLFPLGKNIVWVSSEGEARRLSEIAEAVYSLNVGVTQTPTPTDGLIISADTDKDTYVEEETINVIITVKDTRGNPKKNLKKDGFLIYEYSGKKLIGPYVNGKYLENENFDDSKSSKGIYKIKIEGGISADKHDKIYVCYGCNPWEGQGQVYDFFSITVTPKEKGELEIYLECPSEVKQDSEFEMILKIKNPTDDVFAYFEQYTITAYPTGITLNQDESYFLEKGLGLPTALAEIVWPGAGLITEAVREASSLFFIKYIESKGFKHGIAIPPKSEFYSKIYATAPDKPGSYRISVEFEYQYETYHGSGMQQWFESAFKSWQNRDINTGLAYTEKQIRVKEKHGIPGFEAIFGIAGLLAVAYLLRRRK